MWIWRRLGKVRWIVRNEEVVHALSVSRQYKKLYKL